MNLRLELALAFAGLAELAMKSGFALLGLLQTRMRLRQIGRDGIRRALQGIVMLGCFRELTRDGGRACVAPRTRIDDRQLRVEVSAFSGRRRPATECAAVAVERLEYALQPNMCARAT